MKNTIYILITTLVYSFSSAQTIVDMAGNRQNEHYKNGQYYIKDINNYMLSYIGTWRYVDGNKEFRITLTKVTKYHDVFALTNDNHFIDALYITYQKYENGQLVYNSPQDEYPTGIIKEFGKLNMSFTDYERNNETFPVDLILMPIGNNQYNLKFRLDMFEKRNTYFEQHPNEPYFSVPNNIVMNKL
ncbi:DUF6705 family protein [Flavobacterium chuncheonense]|uniref:DUF6705 family protein n=1 Tax=Flavobacterium chuncheonense TaxID=2026653 RepID=A0ABW5YJR2_9FLAO